MDVFGTIFHACCVEGAAILAQYNEENTSFVEDLCARLALVALNDHAANGVLDFEEIAPVLPAWWVKGLSFVILLSMTVLLSCVSIHIFLDSAMRSPTNVLLAAISALDLLTCLCQAPINVHEYLLGRYKELPSYTWCSIYFYVHNFLPPSFHGTAFLLNTYLSVQRYVGIKDVRRCRVIGTYIGSIVAIIACLLISFTIHSMYPAMIALEEVTAISKKVLSTTGLYYIESCRINDRFEQDTSRVFSAYMWLRVVLLQVPPALVLSVCNIALIRASYRTHVYRKRLIGSVGIIADIRPSSRTGKPSILTVSGTVGQLERDKRSCLLNSCTGLPISSERVGTSEDPRNKESKLTSESTRSHDWTMRANGEVAAANPHCTLPEIAANSTERKSDKDMAADHTERKSDRERAADPTERKSDKDMAADPTERKSDKDMAADPTERKSDRERAADLTERKSDKDMTVDPTERKSDKDMAADPTERKSDRERAADLTERKSDRERAADLTERKSDKDMAADHIEMKSDNINRLASTHLPIIDTQHILGFQNVDTKNENNLRSGGDFFNVRVSPAVNLIMESGSICTHRHSDILLVKGSSGETQVTRIGQLRVKKDKCIHFDDDFKFGVLPEQVVDSDTGLAQDQPGPFLEAAAQLNTVSSDKNKRVLTETLCPLKLLNAKSTSNTRDSDSNNISKGGKSKKSNVGEGSAEIRSTILLLLVTSCTLATEMFVISLLLLKFLKAKNIYGEEVMSYCDLASLLMACNMMMVINFPLNFIFFCGLSHAFRTRLKVKLSVVIRKLKLTCRPTTKPPLHSSNHL